jgi:hypothetical protein
MAVIASFMLSAGTAHAQFLFWPRYTFRPGHYAPFKHKHHHPQTNSESARNARPKELPKGPLQIIISITDQRVSLFDNGTLIVRSSASTGIQGHPTPLGVFSVIGLRAGHFRLTPNSGHVAAPRKTRTCHHSFVAPVGSDVEQFIHAVASDRRDDPELSKMSADRIDRRSLLTNKQAACAVMLLREQLGQVIRARTANFINLPRQCECAYS